MKNYIHGFKCLKVAELFFMLILELVFLFILISNKALRSSIFVDKSLFILCAIAYFTVVFTFIYLLIDFFKIKGLKRLNHELENIAYIDSTSGIPNRTSCDMFFETYVTPESMKGIGLVLAKIANLPAINSNQGRSYGNHAIVEFSHILKSASDGLGFIGRNGGNEFITVISDCNDEKISAYFAKLNDSIAKYNKGVEFGQLDIRYEYVLYDQEQVNSFSDLIAKAYTKYKENN